MSIPPDNMNILSKSLCTNFVATSLAMLSFASYIIIIWSGLFLCKQKQRYHDNNVTKATINSTRTYSNNSFVNGLTDLDNILAG